MSNFTFANPNQGVTDLWRYFVPETKQWFRNYLNLGDLMSAVKQHYKTNQLPCPGNLEELIADQLCPDLPPEQCLRGDGTPQVSPTGGPMTFADVINLTRTMGGWAIAGLPKVTDEEADRRSWICAGCHLNRKPVGCPKCNSAKVALLKAVTASRPTKYDSKLEACAVCKCFLKVKVWFPLEIILPHMSADQISKLPDFCWLKK